MWSKDFIHDLQDCLRCTDWDCFEDACADLDDLKETVSAVGDSSQTYLIYLNNKAWAKAVKNSINHQNISFNQGDLLQYRQL